MCVCVFCFCSFQFFSIFLLRAKLRTAATKMKIKRIMTVIKMIRILNGIWNKQWSHKHYGINFFSVPLYKPNINKHTLTHIASHGITTIHKYDMWEMKLKMYTHKCNQIVCLGFSLFFFRMANQIWIFSSLAQLLKFIYRIDDCNGKLKQNFLSTIYKQNNVVYMQCIYCLLSWTLYDFRSHKRKQTLISQFENAIILVFFYSFFF